MEKIKSFLQQISIEADVRVQVGKDSPHRVRASVRFVFLEVTSSANKCAFFLPIFTPTLSGDGKTLTLQPNAGTGAREVKLLFTEPEKGNEFMVAINAVPQLWKQFYNEFRGIPIEAEEQLGSQRIRVSRALLLEWVGKGKKEMKMQLTGTSKVTMPKVGKHIKMMVSEGPDRKEQRIEMPAFEALCRWFLVVFLCIDRAKNGTRSPAKRPAGAAGQRPGQRPRPQQKPQQPKPAAPAAPEAAEPSPEPGPEPKSEEVQASEPKKEEEKPVDDDLDIGEIEIETIMTTNEGETITVPPDALVPPEEAVAAPTPVVDVAKEKRRLAVDLKKLEQVKEEVKQMETELKMQLDAYEPVVVTAKDLDEPVLKFPDATRFLSGQPDLQENVVNAPEPMSLELLQKKIRYRIDDWKHVNYSRYNEKFVLPVIGGRELGYDPLSVDSYRAIYKRATPEDAFVLVAAVLANGSLPSVSMSPLFGVARQASKQADILMIVETLGTKVFSKILEFDGVAENYYMPSAMIGDRHLMEVLSRLPKQIEKPEQMPSTLPFQFPMNPLRAIEKWFYDTLYELKVNKLDVKKSVFRLGRSLGELFSSYLRVGNTLADFVRELGETGLTSGAWTAFRQNQRQDFEANWVFFWAFSFKDDTLSANFCEILKRGQLIDKYYATCAPIRSAQTLRSVVEWLAFFESLNLASQLDLRNYEDKSFTSLLARTAAWVESIGF